MTTAKEPKGKKDKSTGTDWERVRRQEDGLEPIDTSDMPELDGSWFEAADIKLHDDIAVDVNLDQDVVDWFESNYKKYRTTMNIVLKHFVSKPWKLRAAIKSNNRILVTATFNKDMMQWFRNTDPHYPATESKLPFST